MHLLTDGAHLFFRRRLRFEPQIIFLLLTGRLKT
jgi:hypothetical protein